MHAWRLTLGVRGNPKPVLHTVRDVLRSYGRHSTMPLHIEADFKGGYIDVYSPVPSGEWAKALQTGMRQGFAIYDLEYMGLRPYNP